METETENEDLFGDIGNLEVPNIDINLYCCPVKLFQTK